MGLNVLRHELALLFEALAKQRRPLVLWHGKGWRVESIGRRTYYTSPEGVSYVEAEPDAEPDVVIAWRNARMKLAPLRLREADMQRALRREQRRESRQQREVSMRRKKRRAA